MGREEDTIDEKQKRAVLVCVSLSANELLVSSPFSQKTQPGLEEDTGAVGTQAAASPALTCVPVSRDESMEEPPRLCEPAVDLNPSEAER
ncbi:hypothetical protein IRJ41_002480 [Triplophysa rosa]|uniref:Uncharacterized protein n=1 Tax=Triplophysa rosa TaxID=992332 RepID=A0A9W8C7R7_TRIRA|nr:hypothetical protein IRJ41_002480 [Triplophysa rosa]